MMGQELGRRVWMFGSWEELIRSPFIVEEEK